MILQILYWLDELNYTMQGCFPLWAKQGGVLFDSKIQSALMSAPSCRERSGEWGKKDHLCELGGGTSVAAAELHWRQLNLVELWPLPVCLKL